MALKQALFLYTGMGLLFTGVCCWTQWRYYYVEPGAPPPLFSAPVYPGALSPIGSAALGFFILSELFVAAAMVAGRPAGPGLAPANAACRWAAAACALCRRLAPAALPAFAVVNTAFFLAEQYVLGAEGTVCTWVLLCLTSSVIYMLATASWRHAGVAMAAALLLQAGLTAGGMLRGTAHAQLVTGVADPSSMVVELVFSLFGAAWLHLVLASRNKYTVELELRRNFALELRCKQQREISRGLVRSMLPPPVIAEIRAALDAGLRRVGGTGGWDWASVF